MKLDIDRDEIWPVYNLQPAYIWTKDPEDIPDEVYAEYLDLQYKWVKMQRKLEEYYETRQKRINPTAISIWADRIENLA